MDSLHIFPLFLSKIQSVRGKYSHLSYFLTLSLLISLFLPPPQHLSVLSFLFPPLIFTSSLHPLCSAVDVLSPPEKAEIQEIQVMVSEPDSAPKDSPTALPSDPAPCEVKVDEDTPPAPSQGNKKKLTPQHKTHQAVFIHCTPHFSRTRPTGVCESVISGRCIRALAGLIGPPTCSVHAAASPKLHRAFPMV